MNMLHDSLRLCSSPPTWPCPPTPTTATNDLEVASLVPQTPASLTGGRHAYKVPEQGAKEGAVSSV